MIHENEHTLLNESPESSPTHNSDNIETEVTEVAGAGTVEDKQGDNEAREYLSSNELACKLVIQESKNSIEINYPVPHGIISREMFLDLFQKLETLLRGRLAKINLEAGLLLRSKINEKLNYYYASNNTNVFRRAVYFNDFDMITTNELISELLDIDFSNLSMNVRVDTNWEYVMVTNIRVLAAII